MNITSKSRYALKIMMDLAICDEPLTQRAQIATRQSIPLDYMDQILSRLRDHALISSIRGRAGGYRLAKAPHEVSVFEIFTAVGDSVDAVQCLEHGGGCVVEHICEAKDAWGEISSAIRRSLSGILLSDLVAKKRRFGVTEDLVKLNAIECRAPARAVNAKHNA